MKKLSCVLGLLLVTFLCGIEAMTQTNNQTSSTATPPASKKIPKSITAHGETWNDDYFWLREKKNPEVISYLEAENAYTEALMKPTQNFQETLYREMLGRIKETDANVPYREGQFLYNTRTEQGKQYPIYVRRRADRPDAPEEITLDLNEMAKGHTYMAVNAYDVSTDANLLAYSTDTNGYREYTLYVKTLGDGRNVKIAERVSSAAWANDNRTLFYVVDDPTTKRSYRLYRHTLGKASDELVYEETDEMFDLTVRRARSRGYIFLTATSHTTADVRYVSANDPSGSLRLVAPREAGHEYYVEHRGDTFYIRTNEGGAKNFKLAAAPAADPQRKNWKELLPHRKDVMLERADAFKDFLVTTERAKGLPTLRILDLRADKSHDLEFPEPTYNASLGTNKEFDTRLLRFNYQSFITPSSVYDYDMQTRKRELLKQQPVLGGYDQNQYKTERIYAALARA